MYGRGCTTESSLHAYLLISETEGKEVRRGIVKREVRMSKSESKAASLQRDVYSSMIP